MSLAPWMFWAVCAGLTAEFAVLAIALRRAGLGRWTAPLFWFLLSGALLIASAGLLAAGAGEDRQIAVAGLLLGSLVTHVLTLVSAWRCLHRGA